MVGGDEGVGDAVGDGGLGLCEGGDAPEEELIKLGAMGTVTREVVV